MTANQGLAAAYLLMPRWYAFIVIAAVIAAGALLFRIFNQ